MKHWARKYIGKPWAEDASGPAQYSCWGLVRAVFKERHGIEFPDFVIPEPGVAAIKRSARISGMKRVSGKARDGDIAMMCGIGKIHCGVVIRKTKLLVLHSSHEAGVVCEEYALATRGMFVELWRRCEGHEEVVELPQNRDVLRGILTIAAYYFLGPAGGLLSGTASFVAVVAASIAINALLPPAVADAQSRPQQTGDVFSASLQGNQARIDQPIPKICGRREVNPPFAAQPYFEYRPRVDEEDPDLDNDQYYFALFAVGIGNHEVIAKIGNTPITRFEDVIRADYLAPGVQPTEVLANVTTVEEVAAGHVLEPGRYVGGFVACRAGSTAESIGIDVVATRGLGSAGPLTVEWRVEIRHINDFGQVLTAWQVLATESRTAFTATPQHWSDLYALGTEAGRVEVRVVRTDVQDTDPAALHEIAWSGLRAYLAEPATLNPNAAHFEVVMRASSQLSATTSRDFRLIVKAQTRTLNEDLEWQAEEHTRNPMWWALDLCTSDTWGINKPDSRVDLQSFYDIAQTCEARQDRFDFIFDNQMNAWDALQLIARTCRSRVFRRNGVISVARDELQEIPLTAFTPRNCLRGMSINETVRRRKSPDGVIVEYQDHRTWEWTEIECPCPGVSDMERPVFLRIPGVIGATHAEREGVYEAANLLYRTRMASFTTEMQGLLPAYMSPVDFLPDIVGYGSSGDVAFWDEGSLTATLTEPPDWSQAPLYLTLIRDDGTCADPVEVTAGAEPNEVILPGAPDFSLVLNDGTRERPKYLIGAKDLVKITAIEDGGKTDDGAQLFKITGLIDDERVHTADIALLPETDEIQDPVGDPDDSDETASGDDFIVNLTDRRLYAEYISGVGANSALVEFTLHNDGLLSYETQDGGGGGTDGFVNSQWILSGEIDPSEAALFEVKFTGIGNPDGYLTTPGLGTWLSLGTSRTVTFAGATPSTGSVRVEIRTVATEIVQQNRIFSFELAFVDSGGGGA